MAFEIKNVALAGYGRIGSAIVSHLVASKAYNLTILPRASSTTPNPALTSIPSSIKIQPVDYADPSNLETALKGIDAVVSTVAMSGIPSQKTLITAARAAGVRLFIPADYSIATADPIAQKLPIYALVVEIQRFLAKGYREDSRLIQEQQQQQQQEGEVQTGGERKRFPMEWVVIAVGVLVEFVFDSSFIVDFEARRAVLWDGGEGRVSISSFDVIGAAVVGVLKNLSRVVGTKGQDGLAKCVQVHGGTISQKEALERGRKYETDIQKKREKEWEVSVEDSQSAIEDANKRFAEHRAQMQGPELMALMTRLISAASFGDGGFESAYRSPDNEWLGVPFFQDGFIEEQVRLRVQEGPWAHRFATAAQESIHDMGDTIMGGYQKEEK